MHIPSSTWVNVLECLHSEKKGTETVPHKKKDTEIAPLGVPNYGQPNSTRRVAVLAPFFLSVVRLRVSTLRKKGTETVPHKKKGTEIAPLGVPN